MDEIGGYVFGRDDHVGAPKGVDHEGDRDQEAAKQDDGGNAADLLAVKATSTEATHSR
ncbi:MAG TPA: hypothetical protein VK735_26185 [Pseudonocardia sp.]|nr:hypothetical protein [Pseudonocardia sp.]